MRKYIVAATPRSGSYLLCEGLEATGIAGRPSETFARNFQYIWRRLWSLHPGASFDEYFEAAIRYGTTGNGVYGLKIHWMDVVPLAQSALFIGQAGRVLDHLFPDAIFVNIVRRNRRAQAISYLKALQTNEWWRIEGVANEQKNGAEPVFDRASAERLEEQLAIQQQAWEDFFEERRIEPLSVEYEVLTEDYRGQVARVLTYLDLDASVAHSIPPPRLVRQADQLSDHWLNRMEAPAH